METWFCLFDDECLRFEVSYVTASSKGEAIEKFKKHLGYEDLPQRGLLVINVSEIPMID